MIRAFQIFLFLVVTPRVLVCQVESPTILQSPVQALGVSIGINDYHFRDEYLSPFSFGGRMFSSRISFRSMQEQTRHTADIFFSAGSVNSDKQPRDINQYAGSVVYSFYRSVDTWNVGRKPLEVFIGAGISTVASFTEFIAVDRSVDYRHFDHSWYWSNGLNLHVLGDYRFGEARSLSAQLTTPLVRLVARPENGHEFNEKNKKIIDNFLEAATDGTAELLWENLVLFLQLEYREQLNNRIGFQGTYSFGYVSSDTPLAMGMYWNSFLVGLFWLL